MTRKFDRRNFLKLAVGTAVITKLAPMHAATSATAESLAASAASDVAPTPIPLAQLAGNTARPWISPNFWGNRLQDWQLNAGRIECISDETGPDLRTVAVLTRELAGTPTAGSISVTLGRISPKGKGFAGFLVGAGAGKIDPRAAALVQKASGKNGGMLCVVDTEGKTSFRDHTNEDTPLQYAEIPSETKTGSTAYTGQDIRLTLNIKPSPDGNTATLELIAGDPASPISTSTLSNHKSSDLTGGLMLASAATSGPDGARYWFKDMETSGDKITRHPDRALGPILGTLYSLNRDVMKMSAQLMPVATGDSQLVKLSIRESPAYPWREVASEKLSSGFCVQFRVTTWDHSKDWQYRVSYADNGTASGTSATYDGTIVKDPVHDGKPVSIGLYSCTTATGRNLDGGGPGRDIPGAQDMGRYTPANMYFPFNEIVDSARHHNPDIFLFVGDQFYEGNPTAKVRHEAPLYDYLYKYYMWLWSFRDLTRNRPTLIMVDDHDMFQGNIWGNGGRRAPDDNQDLGGYVHNAEWVNMVQNTQCGHNPDPWDPTPVDQGITVYYCAFQYGGIDFAMLEDRKFKTGPVQGVSLDVHVAQLLGKRQEKFLTEWAAKVKGGKARVVMTATLLGCAQTSPDGEPLTDFDSNGYPALARNKAVALLREADALILSGDQHMASVIRLGDETYIDGPIQFTGPAGAANWTRWFEPAKPLPNAGAHPNTGDFRDGYGNHMRVLAVANPNITFADYRKHRKGRGQGINDRNLKAEGYGIVNVNLDARQYTLNCWRWDTDSAAPDAKQYTGWPMQLSFDEIAKG